MLNGSNPMLRVMLSIVLATTLTSAFGIQAFANEAATSTESADTMPSENASSRSSAPANQVDAGWTTCGTCEWAIDEAGTLTVRPENGTEGTLKDFYLHPVPWAGKDFISVSFEGKVTAPSARRMFEGCSSLESADLTGLDTSSTEDMSNMFYGCSSLSSVDLSALDTSSATNMSFMFDGCSSLESVDLSGFDASSLTDVSNMLAGCSSLESVKVPEGFPLKDALPPSCHWLSSADGVIYESADVPSSPAATYTKVEPGEPGCVFRCGTCEWIVDEAGTLIVKPVDASPSGELRDWSVDPDACSPWAGLPIVSARFEGRVIAHTAAGMFSECSSLKAADLSSLDTSSAKDMSNMFRGCSSLSSIDLSGLDCSNVVDASYMFSDCSSLKSLDLSTIDMPSIIDMDVMFSNCSSLESIDLPRLNTQSLRGLTSTFRGCSSLRTLDLSEVDAPRLYDLDWTFADCSSLESIDFSSSRFSRMESMIRTFYNCASLQSLDLSSFDTSKVTEMSYMFEGCRSLEALDLSDLDTSNVSSMRNIFADCNSLQSLVLPSFERALYTCSMFYFNCGESFLLTVGSNFDSYDVTTNSFASFPSVRTGHYLDRIVTGRWTNVETGEVLDAKTIPSRVAATYAPEVLYRDLDASVEVSSSDTCPAYELEATVNFGSGVSDPELELYYQWFDASSDQPASPISATSTFSIPEDGVGKEYYCIVTDGLEDSRNEVRSDTITANHLLDEQWAFDESDHWRVCSACGTQTDESSHTFGEWKIVQRPFSDKPGEKERSCTVCGYAECEEVTAEPFGNPFVDVFESSTPHYEDIQWLAEHGITTGFPDDTFRPYDSIARCDMAAFLYRLAGSPDYEVTDEDMSAFTDVNADTPHLKEVCWLASTGISTGFPDGTFRPYANIARCDMAAFLQRLGRHLGAADSAPFILFCDVNDDTPHADAIEWLGGAGITNGFTEANGILTYRPYENVARCDMAAFLHRMNSYVER